VIVAQGLYWLEIAVSLLAMLMDFWMEAIVDALPGSDWQAQISATIVRVLGKAQTLLQNHVIAIDLLTQKP